MNYLVRRYLEQNSLFAVHSAAEEATADLFLFAQSILEGIGNCVQFC